MWYLLASLAALSLNKSLAYLMLGLTAFLGWKQGILDAPALLVIASIVVGWSAVEWLRNKNNKYTYLVEGLCVAIAVALVLHLIPGFHNPKCWMLSSLVRKAYRSVCTLIWTRQWCRSF
jgi:hypothetical protein